jgi:hypothetical protein
MRRIDHHVRRIRAGAHMIAGSVAGAVTLAWFAVDHVRRRLTGRPGLFDELFEDLRFEIDERDVAKPYDAPGSGPNTKQTGGRE